MGTNVVNVFMHVNLINIYLDETISKYLCVFKINTV